MALFTPEVTWHEYSNGIGSEDVASPPDGKQARKISRQIYDNAVAHVVELIP